MGRPIIEDEVMAVTVIYIDRVAVLNLAVDYLLLLTTATLAGTPLRRLRFGLGAAIGAAYAVLALVLPPLSHPLCKLGAGAVMALCAFWREVRPWRLAALFGLLSGGLAGVLLALEGLGGAPLLRRLRCGGVSCAVLLGAAAAFYLLLRLYFRQGARHEGGEVMDIEVVVMGRRCRLRALRDSGNNLRDPVRGQPVLVVEAAALTALWPPEAAVILRSTAPPEEKMTQLHKAGVPIPFVLLPFQAVGTVGGLLLACRSDYLQLGRRRLPHILVALTDTPVGAGGYQALWGGQEGGTKHDALAAHHLVDPAANQAG